MARVLRQERASALKLDAEKRKIEKRFIPRVKKVLSNLAKDASALYNATGTIDASDLAQNYSLEFTKEIRDMYRVTIRKFGFDLRSSVTKKGISNFNTNSVSSLLDIFLKQEIILNDDIFDLNITKVDAAFLRDSTIFVANQSEQQAGLITNTNEKSIGTAIVVSTSLFDARQAALQDDINDLQTLFFDPDSDPVATVQEMDKLRDEIQDNNENKNAIIAEGIEENLEGKSEHRATLITDQNVGLSESWAREKEAELIEDIGLILAADIVTEPTAVLMKKEWVAILDTRTRPAHVTADAQVVQRKDSFIVGGESLQFPRDPIGSAGNVLNCRCVVNYTIE